MSTKSEEDGSTNKGLSEESFTGIMGQVVDVLARFEASNKELHNQLKDQRNEPRAPEPKPTPKPQPSNVNADEAVQALLSGNVGPLKELIGGQSMNPDEFAQVKGKLDQVVNYIQMQAGEQVPQNEAHFRAQVDSKWGEGAFDKYVKEALDAKFEGNDGMRANRTYFDQAVKLVVGERVDDLLTHQGEVKAAADAADKDAQDETPKYPYMLGGGVPISLKGGKVQFDGEDEQWITKYEANNGEEFDREGAQKMVGALLKSSAGKPMVTASIDDLDKAFPQENE